MNYFFGFACISLMYGFFMCLIFESPFAGLEKILFGGLLGGGDRKRPDGTEEKKQNGVDVVPRLTGQVSMVQVTGVKEIQDGEWKGDKVRG